MGPKLRDILLILFAAGLVTAAILPSGGEDDPAPAPAAKNPGPVTDPPPVAKEEDWSEPGASAPVLDAFHLFWPLVPGSTWTYRVEGPEELVPAATWTMTVKTAPAEGVPGELEAGFGHERRTARVWMDAGAVRTDVLPLTTPARYRDAALGEAGGAFLKAPAHMIEGSVWDRSFEADVEYVSTDRLGKTHRETARAFLDDRATVEGIETVIVAAGRFEAVRIGWLGRIELEAKKRRVLERVTSEPYRRESTWMARGIGMVRRRVEFADEGTKVVTFDLVSYRRPSAEGGG
jgi:hypothetical protein